MRSTASKVVSSHREKWESDPTCHEQQVGPHIELKEIGFTLFVVETMLRNRATGERSVSRKLKVARSYKNRYGKTDQFFLDVLPSAIEPLAQEMLNFSDGIESMGKPNVDHFMQRAKNRVDANGYRMKIFHGRRTGGGGGTAAERDGGGSSRRSGAV